MEVQLFMIVSLLAGTYGTDGSNKRLYLVDLYTCVDEFEDYCHHIPYWTVRAAVGLANDCDDILPGYTLSTPHEDFVLEGNSLIKDGEVIRCIIMRGGVSCSPTAYQRFM